MATLLQYGPNWLVLATMIWLLKRVLEKQYKSFCDDQRRVHNFFERAQESMDRFSETIIKNQSTILVTIKDTSRASNDIILDAVRTMNEDSTKATGGIILALGIKENHTVEAIERLLIALREDLATARAAPPAGGTGSQVYDSAKDGKGA